MMISLPVKTFYEAGICILIPVHKQNFFLCCEKASRNIFVVNQWFFGMGSASGTSGMTSYISDPAHISCGIAGSVAAVSVSSCSILEWDVHAVINSTAASAIEIKRCFIGESFLDFNNIKKCIYYLLQSFFASVSLFYKKELSIATFQVLQKEYIDKCGTCRESHRCILKTCAWIFLSTIHILHHTRFPFR